MNIVEIEKEIKGCILAAVNKSDGLSQRELRAKWLDTLKGKKDPV